MTPLAEDYVQEMNIRLGEKRMLLGKVTGSLWATRKDEKLNGSKFMLVKTWNMNLEQAEGLLVAADNAGAGVGDLVLITQGMAARISRKMKESR